MGVGVNPPKTPITKGSNGIATATLPNMCKMPGPPAPFVPAPLPNIGKSSEKPKGYSKKVKVEKKTVAIKGASFGSMGDMASKGTGGGMVSANTHGPCKFISPGSMDVKFEGKNVHLLSDLVTNNGGDSGSPANSATMMGAIQNASAAGGGGESDKCRSLRQKIENIKNEIYNKRYPDLENNPGNLPERIGPGERLRDTVRGHKKLLNRQLRRLRELEKRYDEECI